MHILFLELIPILSIGFKTIGHLSFDLTAMTILSRL